jgi:sigma-E factor negative regulatory protein RseA
MSEQIREQVSAFLDGELPNSETELLLKRLTRDHELRESFGRYALIGEALRGEGAGILTKGFASRVNLAIDGEPAVAHNSAQSAPEKRWWRPIAGVSVVASVAAVAIVALQQRAISPGVRSAASVTAQNAAQSPSVAREALSYTVPASTGEPRASVTPARLTNYVFAHSKYSSGLGQRGLLADLLIEDDAPPARTPERAAQPLAPDVRTAP